MYGTEYCVARVLKCHFIVDILWTWPLHVSATGRIIDDIHRVRETVAVKCDRSGDRSVVIIC